jgi:hypothetical protein
MGVTQSGKGYWLLDRHGKLALFGDAPYFGSPRMNHFSLAIGIVRTPSGHGYWIAVTDSGMPQFGDARPSGNEPDGDQAVGLATPWASSSGYGLILIEAHQQHRQKRNVAW